MHYSGQGQAINLAAGFVKGTLYNGFSPITRSRNMDPVHCVIAGFQCIWILIVLTYLVAPICANNNFTSYLNVVVIWKGKCMKFGLYFVCKQAL